MLETSNFVDGSAMRSLSLVMSECSLSGRGQGHVSNLYIVDFSPQQVVGIQVISTTRRFVYDTYKTMEATRSRHGWVLLFITHCTTVTLQLHNFDFFRTCRTSSFCTVAWQIARFQLTWRIALSLGNSWASCFTARCYASAVLAMGLCRCLSQVGVLLKRLNIGSHKQNHTIAQGL